ncbi:MAG: divergent polysaccharide deacetylase family protein [Rhodospirillaceae bacterium]
MLRQPAPHSRERRWRLIGRWFGRLLIAALVVGAGIGFGLAIGYYAHPSGKPPLLAPVPPAPVVAVTVVAEGKGEEPAHESPVPESAAAPVATVEPAPEMEPEPVPAPSVAVVAEILPPPHPPSAPPPSAPLWLRNAVPMVLPSKRPMIVLVFDDLGPDRVRSARVIALHGPLTLSFLPYAADLPRLTRAAHAQGHELMVHMPMEPLAANLDPGPGALLTRLPAEEILHRLERALAVFDGYVGINNHMGSRFTSDRVLMTPVLAELNRRGLLFLDSVTSPGSVGFAVAASLGMPHARRNVFLDDELTPAAIHASLIRLEQVARHTGIGIGIGHPHDVTLEAVTAWLPGLAAKGFVLAPISAAVRVTYSGKGQANG